MTNQRARFWGGLFLVGLALIITISEIAMHLYGLLTGVKFEVSHTDLFAALIIGFVGMYVLSPRRAKDGGQFLVNSTVRVIQVIRNGRRKTDAVAAVVEDEAGNQATIHVPTMETEIPVEMDADTPKRRSSDQLALPLTKEQESADGKRNG
jgi:hypothetical protein